VRSSRALRYTATFSPPTQPFATDASTAALYHFDEGSGTSVNDTSGAAGGPSNGVLNYGGSPAGPVWSTDTPFAAATPTSFFTLTPCWVVDTRNPPGPWGAPALAAGAARTFTLRGRCGIPITARAVSMNVTVTGPTGLGNLRLYPAGSSVPLASAINYAAGQTRANNAVVWLNGSGELDVRCDQASGTVQFILDVNGWFE
jgi:hypothetical protein